jgi:hypothetical protein
VIGVLFMVRSIMLLAGLMLICQLTADHHLWRVETC